MEFLLEIENSGGWEFEAGKKRKMQKQKKFINKTRDMNIKKS